jgi:hypothetical protein
MSFPRIAIAAFALIAAMRSGGTADAAEIRVLSSKPAMPRGESFNQDTIEPNWSGQHAEDFRLSLGSRSRSTCNRQIASLPIQAVLGRLNLAKHFRPLRLKLIAGA